MSAPLDRIDRQLLQSLQADARQSAQALSEAVHLSARATLSRIRRLQEEGLIEGCHAHIQRAALGEHVALFAEVTLKDQRPATVQRFERHVAACREVVGCWLVSGAYDYLLRLGCRDLAHYRALTDAWLADVGLGIERIVSLTELQTVKEFTGFPLPPA
ncbi:Lrp/AsnC family transcriptional regulator [Xenophilus arseniciresistens]|uniref:Lrp/AsnC family transcriptional regulator n=1 Tax=Xenophilus arseniciresistens TaxID=1283306 RepID=A0AAE3NCP9_9BURK|nr:Lrp/AsnC family transcriptional regulator [Xenophilus arseniciresistens]MDA7418659.1 Lrp/AsnC family transcriptional regulator [Xenophilus arseniciresistens]